jgi:hypothetical protein
MAYFTHAQSGTLNQSFVNNGVLISHINLRVDDMSNACKILNEKLSGP